MHARHRILGYVLFKLRIKKLIIVLFTLSLCFYSSQLLISYYFFEQARVPIIIWWTPMMAEMEQEISCYDAKYTCLLTKNRNYFESNSFGAYLFYGSKFDPAELPTPKRNTWALFHEESPRNSPVFLYNSTQALFEITATFSRHSDFPVTLQYLENANLLVDSGYYIGLMEKNKLMQEEGLAPILYVQSDCDTPNDRDKYVKELMQYIKVDSFGKCLRNEEFPESISNLNPLDLYNDEFMKFVAKYKFVIAFENAICEDYITEKLWRPLMVGSVPVYWGSPSVEDWLPNNFSAILVKNFKSPKDLADRIHQINLDDRVYGQFMRHIHTETIDNDLLRRTLAKGIYGLETDRDHPISAFECFVCKQLHENHVVRVTKTRNASVYDCAKPLAGNSWQSHWKLGKCQSRALQNYARNGGRLADDQCRLVDNDRPEINDKEEQYGYV